jgi:hypothetical protein
MVMLLEIQNLFAIYPLVGWNGTLNYLESGKGYMIKSSRSKIQVSSYLSKFGKLIRVKQNVVTDLGQETIRPEFTSMLTT